MPLTVKRECRTAGVFADTRQRRRGASAHNLEAVGRYIDKYHYASRKAAAQVISATRKWERAPDKGEKPERKPKPIEQRRHIGHAPHTRE